MPDSIEPRPHATFTGFNDVKKRFSQLLNKVINSYTTTITFNNGHYYNFYLNIYLNVGDNWIRIHRPDLTSWVNGASQSGDMQTGNNSGNQ